ncbi:hypothetical protein P3L10_021568 [Capsicum annuum]
MINRFANCRWFSWMILLGDLLRYSVIIFQPILFGYFLRCSVIIFRSLSCYSQFIDSIHFLECLMCLAGCCLLGGYGYVGGDGRVEDAFRSSGVSVHVFVLVVFMDDTFGGPVAVYRDYFSAYSFWVVMDTWVAMEE